MYNIRTLVAVLHLIIRCCFRIKNNLLKCKNSIRLDFADSQYLLFHLLEVLQIDIKLVSGELLILDSPICAI